jgi:AcrR family transcriptional regulator
VAIGQAGQPEATPEDLWLPPLTTPRRRRGSAPKRGAKHPLSRDQIVRAAIEIADREGAEAVGMRRVARELQAGNMSLYWHVAGKDELLALMIDAVEGEYETPVPSGDWRADLTRTARNIRAVLLRHGWMASFVGFRRSIGPNELPHLEHSLAALSGPELGLGIVDAFRVLMAVETYVLGFALRDQQELSMERDRAERLATTDAADITDRMNDSVDQLRATQRYPHLIELFDGGLTIGRDERFEYGLACLLDGIEIDLRTRARPNESPSEKKQ